MENTGVPSVIFCHLLLRVNAEGQGCHFMGHDLYIQYLYTHIYIYIYTIYIYGGCPKLLFP